MRYLNFILATDLGGTNTRLALHTEQEEEEEAEEKKEMTMMPPITCFHTPLVMERFLNEE